MPNAIMAIAPYRYSGTWVFDDPDVELVREPFVAGIPELIDELTAGIADAENGFRLTFSANYFPGAKICLKREREEAGGWWYVAPDGREGWLCPALFRYFAFAPPEIYARADPSA